MERDLEMTAFIWASGCVAVIGLFLVCYMYNEAVRNHIIPIEIGMSRLPSSFDGSVILFITDIHRRNLPRDLLMALKGQVDWILLGGDMMEKNVPLSRVERNMRLLSSVAPVYAVHGNHDYKADVLSLDSILIQCGVELLINKNVRLEKNGSHIWLTGVDYPHIRKRSYSTLPKLPSTEANTCRLVLVHDPAWINRYSTKPADLTLAGHTHGGQIDLPFFGPVHLDKHYRDLPSGTFQWEQPNALIKTATIFISRGFGYRHLPLRFRCPAEINLITLRSK
ncbi:metallophosphoesterase [Paenibacillus sp. FA6]|uniref:metallophosphoesterase n=1 Tax=Paenibacillus sp. FA6 TaxID=3413029 RepID=UPI003F656DC5